MSLQRGGYSFAVVLHEFGHAHGLAHPHDTGGGSEIMLGVAALDRILRRLQPQPGRLHRDVLQRRVGPSSGRALALFGHRPDGGLRLVGKPQRVRHRASCRQRYGVHAANTGNNVYTLQGANAPGTFYQTIWDTGGTDTIAYAGTAAAQIDLLAATLDYTPTGGGAVSFVDNVWGGYTIANGVVIENATGGSGNDALLGNAAANTLTGNDGNDTLLGRGGSDVLLGGNGVDTVTSGDGLDVATLGGGNDIYIAELETTRTQTKAGRMPVDIITDFDAAGDDKIDLTAFDQTFLFKGAASNKAAGDLTYTSYASIAAAEKALGLDIDGNPGAGGVPGPVTVVYGNLDGRAPDFAIILLNTTNVSADDFVLV